MRAKKDLEIDALNEKIRQRFVQVEERFKKILNEIQEALEDMAFESGKFIDSDETFANQFGVKVTSLISELKKPDKISFQDIETYINALDIFQKKIVYYGARWLRRIGPRHKLSVRQIEWKRRHVLNLTKDLKLIFSNNRNELKKWKRAENIVRKLTKLKEERSAKRKALEEVDSRLKELKNLIEKEKKKTQSFGQEEDLVKARELKKDEASFEKRVKTGIRHLEKPVSKSVRLVEDRSIVEDQHKILGLVKFISDPKRVLLDLEDIKTIEEALLCLQELLKSKRLNLKSSRNKKGLETISGILKENKIREYKREFDKFAEQKRKLEIEGVIGKTMELEEIKIEYEKKNESLDHKIKEKKRIEEDIASCEERIKNYSTKIKELI